jgi:phage gp46-like protein
MTLLATFIKAETQDYIAQNGLLIQKNALLTEAYTRSNTPLGTYAFNPLFGNELILKINTRGILTESAITTMQSNALQPMIDQGRALAISIKVPLITGNLIELICFITDTNKITYELPIDFIKGALNG